MPNDIQIAIQDDATLVWIRESNDVAGWRHNRFDSFPEALDFITRWSWGQFCTRRWEPGDPPDVAEIERLKLDIEVIRADEANANYWAGQEVGVAGVCQRWEEALTDPIPKAGVMGETMESLYRRTEALRELLRQAGQVIAWQCFGDCRAFGPEPIPEPADLIAAIERVIKNP